MSQNFHNTKVFGVDDMSLCVFSFSKNFTKGGVAILIECPISSVKVSMIHKNANLNS